MTRRLVTLWCRPGDISLQQVSLHSQSIHTTLPFRWIKTEISAFKKKKGVLTSLVKPLYYWSSLWGLKAQLEVETRILCVNFLELLSLVNAGTASLLTRVKQVITQMPAYTFVYTFISSSVRFVCYVSPHNSVNSALNSPSGGFSHRLGVILAAIPGDWSVVSASCYPTESISSFVGPTVSKPTGTDWAGKRCIITVETKLPPPVNSLCGFDTGELERKWYEPTKKIPHKTMRHV